MAVIKCPECDRLIDLDYRVEDYDFDAECCVYCLEKNDEIEQRERDTPFPETDDDGVPI